VTALAGNVAEMEEAAGVHHGIRRQWLARCRLLNAAATELRASGRSHYDRSFPAMHNDVVTSFGGHLLFEVEAFRAEDFSSPEEARSLLAECANLALADALSNLEQTRELRRHPDWLPELSEILRGAHRETISTLEKDGTAHEPVPPFRRRLTVEEHAAAWEEVERRTSRYPPTMHGYADEYGDLIDALPAHGINRVLVIHPWMERFGCETDVTFLVARHLDWIQLEGYVTSPTFDWFIWIDDSGEWAAYNWPPPGAKPRV
jgi:hypothetical protein